MPEFEEEDILRKIEALLAKTTEAGCTEEEAAASAQLAARLMAKHGITQERLGKKSENKEHSFAYGRGADEWQRLVAGGVAKKFGVAVFADWNCVNFFGMGDAPHAAGIVWQWLVNEMPRVAYRNEAWKYKNMDRYMLGMATTVVLRLNREDATTQEDREADQFAIQRYDQAEVDMAEAHPELQKDSAMLEKLKKSHRDVSFLMGMVDGSEVVLGTEKVLEA